jgi:FAD/FMN-containing dehydrogenase/Fe-S oxidoreductase
MTAAATSEASARQGESGLARRLRAELEGEVLFDAFSRGRYSTDASIYQVEPLGVVVAKSEQDIVRTIEIAREAGVPVLPRGAGTSQCGQTVNEALVVDVSKHLNRVLSLDAAARTVRVEPGIVLDRLNAYLRPHGLFFPVDVSTSAQATIGGMAGNNSCGSRSIRYGNMVHNVAAIDAVLADGRQWHFGPVPPQLDALDNRPEFRDLVGALRSIARREADELAARWPKLLRRVGGYNLDMLGPENQNMAHILVGSEGTLAFSTALELNLQPIPPARTLGVCHFPTFYQAMAATQHIVELNPSAVELVDRTMIELARAIPAFARSIDRFVRGTPEALLLVEFAGDDQAEQETSLRRLEELLGDLGFAGAVLPIADRAFQAEVWEVRKSGLNIMMSMKGDGKPVSFIEDCAVPLADLAEYTDRLNRVFDKHGIKGTWYAHASVGTLHVRPVLNLKDPEGAKTMRRVAEEAFAMVREYKGSHSGEHGDGIVRSEFHEPMFGSRLTRAFEEVKDRFDPEGRFNPGRIVRPPKMDDRTLFRFKPGYRSESFDTVFDWSDWGGFAGAVEMCNNNGACRKDTGVMCPSFRVTGNERDLTRGRANTLRLAISGQLGREALIAEEMQATMDLCVSCKGCKRECPTGVDMARMKVEFLHQYRKRHPLSPRDRLIGYLPRYAPWAARLAPIANLPGRWPWARRLAERRFGLAAERTLPAWRRDAFAERATLADADVVLLPDTFNTYFEPDNLRAALRVLRAGGRKVAIARASDGGRPLCCGRTFLSVGLAEEARAEARRTLAALLPHVERGRPVVGLEPSCLLTLRDEFPALFPGADARALAAKARLFEEYVAESLDALPLRPLPERKALLHGHCHQKAFGAMAAVEAALQRVPGLKVTTVASSCCGMAGAFGYEAEHQEASRAMGELSLLPAVRAASDDTLVVASGTSCRHQIADGAGRQALHVARVLEAALAS